MSVTQIYSNLPFIPLNEGIKKSMFHAGGGFWNIAGLSAADTLRDASVRDVLVYFGTDATLDS